VPKAVDLMRLTIAAIIENFSYRQLANIWRIQGHWHYWRGAAHWGKQCRTGFAPA
jgi:hypothetical protein